MALPCLLDKFSLWYLDTVVDNAFTLILTDGQILDVGNVQGEKGDAGLQGLSGLTET